MGSVELTASASSMPAHEARAGATDAARTEVASTGRRVRISACVRACRPRQWTKNLLLAAAPLAAGVIARERTLAELALAIAAFCLLSSATYLLNDVRDLEQDRRHPRKRTRPVAAGELSVRTALVLALVLALAGLTLAASVRLQLGLVGGGYLALTASYSLWWRHLAGLDILAVAAGFVLRAAAGGVAVDVPLSRWFLLVTSCGALFIVAGKRHAEMIAASEPAVIARAALARYSTAFLRVVLAVSAAGAVMAYVLWAVRRPENGPWYEVTIIPFVLWLGRYGALIRRGAGEAPEELILADPGLLALTLCWGLLFLAGLYVGS